MDRRDYIVINARDVTGSERSRLEREAILANASVGIAVTHAQRFVLANLHFEALFGWPHGELVGQGGRVVWSTDEEYAAIGALYGPALGRGERVDFERRVRRRDGSSFLAFMRAHAIDPEHPSEGGTVWIVEDITERRAAEQALARARDEAEAANHAKSTFLANTSHELRTPLNGIIGLAHLAREPGLDAALRMRYLDQIAESGQALAGIIADILDLSKIEAGKLQIEAAAFDPALLVESLVSAWVPQAAAKGLVLRVETGPGVSDGDILQALAMAMAVRARMVAVPPKTSLGLMHGLVDAAFAATLDANRYQAGRA
jgi:PAS domain S-box-containing protein